MGVVLNREDSIRQRDILEEQERILRYPGGFGSADALELGSEIIGAWREGGYERSIVVRITRESDGLIIFSWAADDRGERHFGYAERKRDAVLKYGHSSAWTQFSYVIDGSCADSVDDDGDGPLGAAGGFPIRVGDEHVATLAVSGLLGGADQTLIVQSLNKILGKDAPQFDAETW